MATSTKAGEFLGDLVGRLTPECAPTTVRSVMEHACGGLLAERRPDGLRASTLTLSGLPFEASVSGGRGQFTPAIRYITENSTQEAEFSSRVAAQLAAVRDLVTWLPDGDCAVVDSLQSFVATLYPTPEKIAPYRSAAWFGIVHHPAAPHHISRLTIYGNPNVVPGTLNRLNTTWPMFAGLACAPDPESLIQLAGVAIEVDAHGDVKHKIYMRIRRNHVAAPMKLTRYFGDLAWEALSELVRCGVDAATLHQHDFLVCHARSVRDTTFTLYFGAGRDNDMPSLVRELALKHHGTTRSVDALTQAAASCEAAWRYSGVALGCSADNGVDKLNVYGTPTWPMTS